MKKSCTASATEDTLNNDKREFTEKDISTGAFEHLISDDGEHTARKPFSLFGRKRKMLRESQFLKKRRSYIPMIILLILIGCILLYFFRTNIIMAVFPREYAMYTVGRLVKNTVGEASELPAEVFGFAMGRNTDFNLKLSSGGDKPPFPFEKLTMDYAPSASSAYLHMNGAELFKENVELKVLWNNRIIGAQIPQLTEDKYYAVSSGGFGKQIMNAKFSPLSKYISGRKYNFTGTDLSFDKIFKAGAESREKGELGRIIRKLSLDFVKKGKIIEKSKTTYTADGKTIKAHRLVLGIPGGDLENYLKKCAGVVREDDVVRRKWGIIVNPLLTGLEKKLRETDFSGEQVAEFIIYGDKLLGFSLKGAADTYSVSLTLNSMKSAFNGFVAEYAHSGSKSSLSGTGSIVPSNNKIEYNISRETKAGRASLDMVLDFNTGRALVNTANQRGETTEYKGTCLRDRGIVVSAFSENSKFRFSLEEGAKPGKLTGREFMVPEKSLGTVMWELGKLSLRSKTARNISAEIIRYWITGKKR